MAHPYHQKILPLYQDLDTDIRHIKPGALRYALNGRNGSSSDSTHGVWENIRGNTKILNPHLSLLGRNKCIGSTVDIKNKRIIFRVWNSLGYNKILLYQPQDQDNLIIPLFEDTPENKVLDFSEFHEIYGTKSRVVNGVHDFFTDAYNEPRYLNIDWCIEIGKKKKWELQQYTKDSSFDIFDYVYNGQSISLYTGQASTLQMSNGKLNDYFTVTDCDCGIEIEEKFPNTGTLKLKNGVTGRLIAQNFYPKPHNQRQLDLVMYPLPHAPKVLAKSDSKINRNFIFGNVWQFRVKINYKNKSGSVWSAWSKMVNTAGKCTKRFKFIEIDYSDDIFNLLRDDNQIHLVESVSIGYRTKNIDGGLYKFVNIPQCKIPLDRQVYKFYNDIAAEAQSGSDDIKPYDAVPLQCGGLNLTADRLTAADIIENYDTNCANFDLDVKFYPKKTEKTATLKTTIRIINTFIDGPFANNQPICIYADSSGPDGTDKTKTSVVFGGIPNSDNDTNPDKFDQYLPDGGWWGYLAGTDYQGLSKQVIIPGLKYYDAVPGVLDFRDEDDMATYTNPFHDERLSNHNMYSELEIKDIPYGTYIFRLKSHLATQDDKLKYGELFYDANNISSQKTSTQLLKVGGVNRKTEYLVVIDDTTVVNGVVTIPEFTIQDASNTFERGDAIDKDNSFMVDGYVIDAGGLNGTNAPLSEVAAGTPVELAYVQCIESNERFTDHNGYYFSIDGGFRRITSGDWLKFNMEVFQRGMPDNYFISDTQNVYKGTLTSLLTTSNQLTNNDLEVRIDTGVHINIPNYNPNISKFNRTFIRGVIKDQTGEPLPGVRVICTETGRVEDTDENGEYKLMIYVRDSTHGRAGTLIFYDAIGCITKEFNTRDFNLVLGENNYNQANNYTLNLVINSEDYSQSYFLKNGETYDFGIKKLDRAIRSTTVISDETKNRLRLPFTTEYVRDYFPDMTTDAEGNPITPTTQANGYFKVGLRVNSLPDVWTTHLYALRTNGQIYAEYIQMVVSNVKYVEKFDTTVDVDGNIVDDPLFVSYGASTANEIYLDLTTSFIEYRNHNSESVKGWAFEKGDRLRLLYKKDGTLHGFKDVEIKEQRGDFFIINNLENFDEIFKGETVEVYRLKTKVEQKIFFETSEYIKVKYPYTEDREWVTDFIPLETGDAYRRTRKMFAKNVDGTTPVTRTIEDPSPDDTYLDKNNDIGRADFKNENFKQEHREALIRFSGKLLADSNLNDLCVWNLEDAATGENNNHGAITIIQEFDNVLFVAQQDRCHVRYIKKQSAYLGDGQQILLNSDRFLGEPEYLENEIGCRNSESFAPTASGCKFFDSYRGIVGQYTKQNGLVNISGYDVRYGSTRFQASFLQKIAEQYKRIDSKIYPLVAKVYGIYNERNDEYNVVFSEVNITKGQKMSQYNGVGILSNSGVNDVQFAKYEPAKQDVFIIPIAMAYSDSNNFWFGFRSYVAEMYAYLGDDYFGFKDGELWKMESNDIHNNFFGVQYGQRLDVVFNKNTSDLKGFLAMSVESNRKWSIPHVEITETTRAYRTQKSRIPDELIEQQNGAFYAPFMMDENTENVENPLFEGNNLMGECLVMRLENNHSDKVVLLAVNIYANYISRTNF